MLAIADELIESELVPRYRIDEPEDGFIGEEGSFTIRSGTLAA